MNKNNLEVIDSHRVSIERGVIDNKDVAVVVEIDSTGRSNTNQGILIEINFKMDSSSSRDQELKTKMMIDNLNSLKVINQLPPPVEIKKVSQVEVDVVEVKEEARRDTTRLMVNLRGSSQLRTTENIERVTLERISNRTEMTKVVITIIEVVEDKDRVTEEEDVVMIDSQSSIMKMRRVDHRQIREEEGQETIDGIMMELIKALLEKMLSLKELKYNIKRFVDRIMAQKEHVLVT